MWQVGIDSGGESGAAVILREGRLVCVVFWVGRRVGGADRFEARAWLPSRAEMEIAILPRRTGAIGAFIARKLAELWAFAAHVPMQIACEDAFLGKNARSALTYARTAGALVGQIEEAFGVSARWIKADEWRAPILGLRRGTKREIAKEASCRLMPARLPLLDTLIRRLDGPTDHVCDAAGIAQWAGLENGNGHREDGASRKPRGSSGRKPRR